VLDLELLIGLRWDLDLVAYPVVYLRFSLCSTADDLICEDSFVNYAIEGTGCAKVLVIDVAILGGEDADEVATLDILLA
jgi:hypothetical protein